MPITDAALAYVLDNRPSEAGVSVLWGDPTPSNTMFRPDGTVAALIDWELAALGPPEIDLAWWLYFDELFIITFGVKRLEEIVSASCRERVCQYVSVLVVAESLLKIQPLLFLI